MSPRSTSCPAAVRRLAAGLALAVVPFTAGACADDPPAATAPAAPGLTPPTNSSAPLNPHTTSSPTAAGTSQASVGEGGQGGAAQEALDGKLGQQVTLPGEVAEILSPHAFTVGGDEIGENPILVVNAKAAGVSVGETVRVQGEVVRFSVPGIEEDLDLDIIDDEFEDFDGDPVIRASSVTRT